MKRAPLESYLKVNHGQPPDKYAKPPFDEKGPFICQLFVSVVWHSYRDSLYNAQNYFYNEYSTWSTHLSYQSNL